MSQEEMELLRQEAVRVVDPSIMFVPDLIEMEIPVGMRIFITSDLHLSPSPTPASDWSTSEVAKVLAAWEGRGVAIFAGDFLELWAGDPKDAGAALAAHRDFVAAVRAFGEQPGRRVLYLVGNHDGRMAWDAGSIQMVGGALGAHLGLAAELTIETPNGPSKVRFEHGHAYDPANAFDDPRNPDDTPLGQHIVQEFLPTLRQVEGDWLNGVETLADPRTFPALISSRIFYRKVVKGAMWLLLPAAIAIVMRIPITVSYLNSTRRFRPLTRDLLFLDLAVILDILFVALFLFLAVRRSYAAAASVVAEERGKSQNDNTRAAAERLIQDGYAGLVCGHTHHAELSPVESGFYANTGSGTKVVDRVDSWFGLPPVFLPRIQLSWVILDTADATWKVTLTAGRRNVPGSTRLEHRVARRGAFVPNEPAVVASYP